MKQRILMILAAMFAVVNMAMAQTVASGTVVSADNGEPVIGASVKVVGTKTGTVTNLDGTFSVQVPSKGAKLEISYIGMMTKTVKAGQKMTVELVADDNALDEVMVVAYGTTKRSSFTGSAGEVKSTDIGAHVNSNAVNSLSGKVAGVSITSSDCAPGSSPKISIRGIGSINASQQPLYIVDGAPYEAGIANINPADIESISVLKDASSSAIYGARGANGVIIITTKKAKDGDAQVTFDAKFGSNSRLIPRYDYITDPGQYYETHFKAMYNSQYYHGATAEEAYEYACNNLYNENNGGLGYQVFTVPEGQNLIGTNLKLNPNATLGYSDGEYYYTPDNWYNEVIHSSFRQEYNASVAGSNNRMNYFASVGYLDDGGIIDNSDYQRYTGRAKVDYQVKKWLKVLTNMSFTHVNSKTPNYGSSWGSSTNVFYISDLMGPIYPLYVRNADGTIKTEDGRTVYDISTNTNQHRAAVVGNAVRDNEYNRKQSYDNDFNGTFGLVLTPISGLTVNATLTASLDNQRYNALYSTFGSNSTNDGIAYVYNNRDYSVNQTYTADYAKTIGKHNFDVLVGYEQYNYKMQYLEGENSHLYDPYIGELDNAHGSAEKTNSSYTDNYMTEGIFGRAQYDFDSKYFLSASIRRDASSVFAPGHRWGTFGSVGLAWQMNRESFLSDVSWVNLLKLKASWGSTGNDGLLDSNGNRAWYAYTNQYTTAYNSSTGQYAVTMYSLGKETITWEKNSSWNFGVDFNLLGNRLNGSFEFFRRNTNGLLYWIQVPASSGLTVSGYFDNIGSLYNQGVELSLEGVLLKTKNIEWNLNLNLTHYKNKITDLHHTIKGSASIYEVGGSVYETYLYKYAGVDHETGEAQYWQHVMYDADGNETTDETQCVRSEDKITKNFDEATQYDCGTTLPKLQGGFGTSFAAYGFDLSAQFSYQLGGKIYDGSYQASMHNGQSAGASMHKDLLNAWSETNTDSNIPRLSTSSSDDGFLTQSQEPLDFFLTSSNYLCLNNLTLGYTFPKKWISKLKLSNLRVYFAGENLFLLTARKGLDPRFNNGLGTLASGAGLNTSSYSAMRSLTGGLSLTF